MPPPAGAPCAKAGVMNKRLSMDKGAWRAHVAAHPRQTGFESVADYTHRPHEINEVAGFPGLAWTASTLFALSSSSCSRTRAMARSTMPADLAVHPRPWRFCRASPMRWSASPPPPRRRPISTAADAFVWHAAGRRLSPVPKVNRVEMSLLRGIDRVRDMLAENTQRFARGLPANNALLWGARGMGKSSLVKAVHAEINHTRGCERPSAQADRDPPRGHRDPARPDGPAARRSAPLHRLLRRSLLRLRTTPPTSR